MKNKPGSFSGGEDEDSQFEDDYAINDFDQDDTMDSNSSTTAQTQPTSNLVTPDSLKRQNQASSSGTSVVRFSEEIIHNSEDSAMENVVNNALDSAPVTKGTDEGGGGDGRPPNPNLNDFYQKENKTLNVNVLAEDNDEMNNEISFDSEKFSKTEAKSRPRGTIDNLTENNSCQTGGINSKPINNSKRLKNSETSEAQGSVSAQCDMICDYNGIKRIRLDSSDKEKNIQLEMERQCSSSSASCGASALMPSSPTLDPARLKEAIEADR